MTVMTLSLLKWQIMRHCIERRELLQHAASVLASSLQQTRLLMKSSCEEWTQGLAFHFYFLVVSGHYVIKEKRREEG